MEALEQTININNLPTPTWNSLKVNYSIVNLSDSFRDSSEPLISLKGDAHIMDLNEIDLSQWDKIKTDNEEIIDRILSSVVPNVISSEGDGKAILRFPPTGSTKLYIKAQANTTLRVIIFNESTLSDRINQIKIHAEDGATVKLYIADISPNKNSETIWDIGGIAGTKGTILVKTLALARGKTRESILMTLKENCSSFEGEITYSASSDDLIDISYIARHIGKNTKSDLVIDGALQDSANKVFKGTIDFQNGCSGSKGSELDNVLMLGDDVINKTVPLILCEEEDVEGNHGASIGELDEKIYYYFQSRGISREQVKEIILHSKIDKLLRQIPSGEIQEEIQAILSKITGEKNE